MELLIESTDRTVSVLEQLVIKTNQSKSELMAQAFQLGVRHLWQKQMLGSYLLGEISRDETIKLVGADGVYLAERQQKAMMEDLDWGLKQ
jgi:hypothetical protein